VIVSESASAGAEINTQMVGHNHPAKWLGPKASATHQRSHPRRRMLKPHLNRTPLSPCHCKSLSAALPPAGEAARLLLLTQQVHTAATTQVPRQHPRRPRRSGPFGGTARPAGEAARLLLLTQQVHTAATTQVPRQHPRRPRRSGPFGGTARPAGEAARLLLLTQQVHTAATTQVPRQNPRRPCRSGPFGGTAL